MDSTTFLIILVIVIVVIIVILLMRDKPKKKKTYVEYSREEVGVAKNLEPKMIPHFKLAEKKNIIRSFGPNAVIPGYVPTKIRNAYGLNNISYDGSGQTIAIVDAFHNPTIINDFKAFDAQFNIGSPDKLIVQSFTQKTNEGWALEAALDVQWAHAIAPKATILLVEAASDSLKDLLNAVKYAVTQGASVVSMSWGSSEFLGQSNYNANFKGNNVLFLASSGDTGGLVNWPSVSPNVLACGGTTLNLAGNGQYVSEAGWSGSGGGKSRYEILPAWQKSFGLNGKRQTPDISMLADPNTGVPVYNTFGVNGTTGWFQVGGTSLSCPMLAGVFAIANQIRQQNGKSNLSNSSIPNYIYNTLGKSNNNFNDITLGRAGTFTCKSGYDNVTGLGSPLNKPGNVGFVFDLINAP